MDLLTDSEKQNDKDMSFAWVVPVLLVLSPRVTHTHTYRGTVTLAAPFHHFNVADSMICARGIALRHSKSECGLWGAERLFRSGADSLTMRITLPVAGAVKVLGVVLRVSIGSCAPHLASSLHVLLCNY